MYTEFRQLKHKWLLLGCYKPPTQSDLGFIASITNIVNFYLQKFGKFVYYRRPKHDN